MINSHHRGTNSFFFAANRKKSWLNHYNAFVDSASDALSYSFDFKNQEIKAINGEYSYADYED